MTTAGNGLDSLTPPDAGEFHIVEREGCSREFVISIPLRFGDQDSYGHVNNARTITLLEEARIRWLNGHAAQEVPSLIQPKLVASHSIDYLHPIEYRWRLEIFMHIARIGRKSFSIAFAGYQAGQQVLHAKTVMVCMTSELVPRALTEPEVAYLQGFVGPPTGDDE